ncbi:MAG: sigma-70 family RNA polymerase sigma factor [Gammaproteobacteria bacterium]|nr:sigma-70 family RNA polymerase sigma factor [Gammaproteobacteria bacterium]MDE2023984.1 sigma-70 family RNA polymerase sigma factor [Gammaproteobacteria bacterium]MDE2139972.1 sigma-70 family RNA polymerase sigma factor [Gammaproteobacteria bacterium]MDE2274557.1 sigma-70 family RNA polymerase sigma factor [Gammaproteobacteria bacterium]
MSGSFNQAVEAGILARACAGERAAQAQLYEHFAAAVYTLARRLLVKPELAEDALQDTFVEVMRGLPAFRGEAPVGMWIRRIAVNRCLMQLRSPWLRYRAAMPPEGEALRQDDSGRWQDLLDMERALEELPQATRAVVWLHDVEGYTHDEIAKCMHATPSFSKSQLTRAYARLRRWAGMEADAKLCTPVLNN